MSEKILKALVQLFAIIAQEEENSLHTRQVVEDFLKLQLSNAQIPFYLNLYDDFLKVQKQGVEGERRKRKLAASSVKVIVICNQINEELTQKQKFIVLLNLIEFVNSKKEISEQEMEFISTVSSSFNIPDEEFLQCLQLARLGNTMDLEDASDWLIIGQSHPQHTNTRFFYSEYISGEIAVLQVKSVGMYLMRYFGKSEILLNGQILLPGKIFIFSSGSSIRSSKLLPIYYSDVVGCFLSDASFQKIQFSVNQIEYKFSNGKKGLRPLTFNESSGKLIGIMGGSGAGKSTLLNILNGNNLPTIGNVYVNGINLHTEKKLLEGVIGYVPQDDLLIEEITVYQNLFYNSKLCFANLSDDEIDHKVVSILGDLGLLEIKDLKVGSVLNKTISGGQRKRLNIALELIREPSLLFVDEPTSGLSSRDSENSMDLLKELALKGKLVFVVIHQPSSDIFKMFDKLLILDKGGYPIYYGNPVESLIYFKTRVNHINAGESECTYCGNVNPEQVFNIIEAKVLDENGNQTRERRISPKEWNEFYKKNLAETEHETIQSKQTLLSSFLKPGFFNQFKVFLVRNVLSKISNVQYMALNLLEAPLLALLLANLIKYYKASGEYVFYENKNLPAYIFMCVIVSLFLGLTVSAEEIIRDRKILKRESFLNLSRSSYLLSKMTFLFLLSALQTLLFVLIGNYILEIKGMYFDYWFILFSASCFANMLGLNISSTFNSAVTIYIVIPLLLIPQILLSGVIVKFEELNPNISSQGVVPLWGESMTSRWAFEALAVNQYTANQYEREIYDYDKQMSNAGFKKIYWYSKMNDLVDEVTSLKKSNPDLATQKIALVKAELAEEADFWNDKSLQETNKISLQNFNANVIKEYLLTLKNKYADQYNIAQDKRNQLINHFQRNDADKERYQKILKSNANKKLEEAVKNTNPDNESLTEEGGRLIQTGDPIFRDASKSRFIRAHFYAPKKSLFGNLYSTYWVNAMVIWLMSLLLFITLYFDVFKKLMSFSIEFRRSKKQK